MTEEFKLPEEYATLSLKSVGIRETEDIWVSGKQIQEILKPQGPALTFVFPHDTAEDEIQRQMIVGEGLRVLFGAAETLDQRLERVLLPFQAAKVLHAAENGKEIALKRRRVGQD